jgi:hypothetical protein
MTAAFDPGQPSQRQFTAYGRAAFPDSRSGRLCRQALPVRCVGPPDGPGRQRGGSVQIAKDGQVIRGHLIRHDGPRELGAFANPGGRPAAPPPPK